MLSHEKTATGGPAFDALLGKLAHVPKELAHVPKEEVQAEEAKYRPMRERLKAKGGEKSARKRKS